MLLMLLSGCAWVSDKDHAQFIDADGDGYYSDRFSDGDDCNDALASVHPDAVEICDGKDQNCDGVLDDGLGGGFLDADGDGYGDPAAPHPECVKDDGYVTNADDCDDANPAANPDAAEVCDGLDNDCDGGIDDQAVWWQDADGDTYGDTDAELVGSCDSPPEGGADNSDDCNDQNAAINPAATDIVGDDIDQNCDGVDGVDGDGDGYAADWSGGDDCDDENAAANPGAAEVQADGIDQDCDGADWVFYTGLSAGHYHSCALDHMGRLACWGYDVHAQVSDAPAPSGFAVVAAGQFHTCALDSSGTIKCWGLDNYGQVSAAPWDQASPRWPRARRTPARWIPAALSSAGATTVTVRRPARPLAAATRR